MASGETLAKFHPYNYTPPATTNYATLSYRNFHPHLEFDASTDEKANWTDVMPEHYSNGGVTAELHFSMTAASTGNVEFEMAFERIQAETLDIDADSFAAVQASSAVGVPTTPGFVKVATITFNNGTQMDSLVAGELYRIQVNRNVGVASNATGDAELHFIHMFESAS